MGDRVSAESPRFGDGASTRGRNHRNRCKGRTVIRWEHDFEDEKGRHRRGDPKLDDDYARQYRPCQGWGANGTDYCAAHGGSAPQTIAAAKRTLALSANDVSQHLVQIANDERTPPETRVKAIAQVLDRIGIRLGVDISLEVPKWQKLMGRMFGSENGEEDTPTGEEDDTPAPPPARQKSAPRKASAKARERPKFEGW
jgi:hypothetical protein